MKKCSNFLTILMFLLLLFQINSCKFFEAPEGKVDLLSIYTTEESYKYDSTQYYIRYCNATLKITNTGNVDIYNSTISLFCETSEREYYKTVSFDITIEPENSIFIPISFDFDTRLNGKSKEKWKSDSLRIISTAWK